MSLIHAGRVTTAVVVVFGMTAFAQANGQNQPAPSQPAAAGQKVTVTGCVARETDYRRSKDAGRGGVAGTGIGADNEFVLTGATISDTPTSSAGGPSPRVAFELTGKNEGLAAQHIGRRVEITGTLKGSPSGVDVASKDLKLREIEVNSISEIGATCPAM